MRERLILRLITLLLISILFSASIMIVSVLAWLPTIVSVVRVPKTPNYDETVMVVAKVIDKESEVESVILSYQVNSASWINVTMNLDDDFYVAEIPPPQYNTPVSYRVYAYDKDDNIAISEIYSYLVIDSYPPIISYVEHIPTSPNYNETVAVFTNITEPQEASGIKKVTLFYKTNGDWQPLEMVMANGLWTATMPGQSADVNVKFYIEVYDNAGNGAKTSTYNYTVKTPPIISLVAKFSESAETVYTGETITFNASESYDTDGTIILNYWDFGDGNTAVGVEVNHAYEDDGIYTVTLTVIDDGGATASTSAVKSVSNRPPVAYFTENATIIKEGEVIHFDASGSHDLDGNIVSYFWDFGDGTNATDIIVDHSYAEDGNYTVTLTVTDDDGASSSMSDSKMMRMRARAVGWPLALLAAIGLGIAALTATLLYGLNRKRKKKGRVSNPGTRL